MDIKEEDKMAFNDLREFIERLEEEDELIRIKKLVDWDLEAGGIARRATELKAPAPLFENIKDYPGYRLLSAQVGPSAKKDRYYCRMAMAMEMKPESGPEEIIEEYIKRKSNPIKPVLVSNGPCKENIFIEDNVDLERFPVPIIHEGDGGRYIGSWHAVATKDLDTEWVNWGMYRLMLHDKETMGSVIVPPQHIGRMFFQKYEPKNLPMEFAVIIGAEPITPMIAGSPIPAGINEMDIIGAIRGKPLDVVKCETVDLVVPATAEIIIEGEVLPNTRLDEGPFGEYVGYRASKRSPKPVLKVKAITHRNNPILTMCALGVPVDEGHLSIATIWAAEILETLRAQEMPVEMVFIPPEGVTHMIAISTKVPYPNFAKKVANAVWASPAGIFSYYVVVVDDDIDVTNINEILWALTTRCHPQRDIYIQPNSPTYPILIPFLEPKDRLTGDNGASVLFDCTWPYHWNKDDIPIKASFDVLWPKELQKRIISNWKEYGF
ncbi:MAG: phenylphosphate carboxylase subunit alpha [Spirochaetes bacterium]|nr:MAG: phenylphosphate carboxylase subunit alpha [Spirochaetota bacterium]